MDYPAIIVAAVLREAPETSVIAAAGIDFITTSRGNAAKIDVVELKLVTSSWPEVILHAERVVESPEFSMQSAVGDTILVVDNSKGTRAVTEQIMEMDTYTVVAVLTEERNKRTAGGNTYLPVVDVVGALISAYQSGRIEISKELSLAESLEAAMLTASIRDAAELGALALAVAHIAYQSDSIVDSAGSDDDVDSADYDTANWGIS